MTAFEVPLSPQPQTFNIVLNGVQYRMLFKWNTVAAAWVLDILQPDSTLVLTGIPLVCGADLLEQFDYMGFGFQLVSQTDGDTTAPPTFTNLGVEGRLYVVTS